MKALVTGGAGFIGSSVVRAGLERGWSVTVLDDLSTGFEENLPAAAGLCLIRGDIRDAGALDEALLGVDAVFHLAAAVGNVRSIENPARDSEINVLGTIQVLEAMRRGSARRLVYSSSAAVFGEPRRLPIDEGHPAEPDSPYGVSKLAAEKHALCYGRLHGWQVACLRYFNVYGVNQRFDAYGNVIPIFATRMLKGERLVVYGDGEQTRDFVNVADVARANWLALDSGASGIFNIGSGAAITINELAAVMQACSGRSPGVDHHASRPGEVRHSVADLTASRSRLGFHPAVRLREGLEAYLGWMGGSGGTTPAS